MVKPPLSHYSPVFANKPWAGSQGYATYFYDPHKTTVRQRKSGKRQWGRKRGLYTWRVERALGHDLEGEAAMIYSALLKGQDLNEEQRVIWAQFLLSQVVRTPTFMRYEKMARALHGIEAEPVHDRVGCRECGDLTWITTRNWCLMLAHPDDYFARSDNPVLLSGFLRRPETCLFYPLSPRVCFAACSMPNTWNPWDACSNKPKFFGRELEKGGAHLLNFHFTRTAGNTLMISPEHNDVIAETMINQLLGLYPQPPFLLHAPNREQMETAFESIRLLMCKTDQQHYSDWLPFELEPFGIIEPDKDIEKA